MYTMFGGIPIKGLLRRDILDGNRDAILNTAVGGYQLSSPRQYQGVLIECDRESRIKVGKGEVWEWGRP